MSGSVSASFCGPPEVLMANPEHITWVDASMASVHLLWRYDAQVTPARIRKWGERHPELRRDEGRYRFNLEEIIRHARRTGAIRP